MKPEDKLALSFYRELEQIGEKNNITLVRHTETGEFFVKKIYDHYDTDIYDFLSKKRLSGIPGIRLLVPDGDRLIIVEEYINGSTISDLVEKQGRQFPPNEVAAIICSICDILYQFHSIDPPLIHRDIKPSNIMLSQTGEVFIIDFNISRLVKKESDHNTELMGTFGYAAPEQYGFEQCTEKTDIYALGVLTKYLLTGDNANLQSYIGPLCKVISKATNLSPKKRFSNVLHMKRALLSEKNHFDEKKETIHKHSKKILACIYTIFAVYISYSSAKDFTPDIDFIPAFICYIILLMSPVIYILFISFKRIRFSKNKTKHRLVSLAVYCISVISIVFCLSIFLAVIEAFR